MTALERANVRMKKILMLPGVSPAVVEPVNLFELRVRFVFYDSTMTNRAS